MRAALYYCYYVITLIFHEATGGDIIIIYIYTHYYDITPYAINIITITPYYCHYYFLHYYHYCHYADIYYYYH